MIRKKPLVKSTRMGKPRKKPKGGNAITSKERDGKAPKIHPAIALMDEWLKDESGYDEEAWPALKKALDEERERVGARRLFEC